MECCYQLFDAQLEADTIVNLVPKIADYNLLQEFIEIGCQVTEGRLDAHNIVAALSIIKK